ncbi:MAG: hypothetical protein EP330_12135 [Deltaproteobacteria bacterium]|nr:MAG: hypothetical protein EP330_12135 [Deltaproteobacteria bacterium]
MEAEIWLLLATALAADPVVPELPPPDRARLNQYHSDPLFSPHLDFSVLGGATERGDPTLYAVAELRLGGTFAVGVGASESVLEEGPTLNWAWRLFSYQHYWSLDLVLRTPVPVWENLRLGLGGDISPQRDGRFAVRARALFGGAGFAGELGLVVRAF